MWYLNDANVNEAINEISPERNAKLQNKPPPTLPRVEKGKQTKVERDNTAKTTPKNVDLKRNGDKENLFWFTLSL